jgi:hypothetical protein
LGGPTGRRRPSHIAMHDAVCHFVAAIDGIEMVV